MSQENANSKSTAGIILVMSLIMSIAALTMSIIAFDTVVNRNNDGSKKVVISKKYDKGKSLEKARATEKPVIVFFYTDWCHFCQKFVPTYDKFTKNSEVKKNYAVAYVNCEDPKNRPFVEEFNVDGFPTVYVISKSGTRTRLENETFFNPDSKEVLTKRVLDLLEK